MKNIYKIGSLVGCLLVMLISCTSEFDNINSDINATEQATPSLLCTNIIINITKYGGDAKSFIANSAGPKYIGYANEGQMGAQYNNPGSGSFGDMVLLPNIEKMNELAVTTVASDIQNSYKGVGKFVKSWIMFRMTMSMGDIPYTEAGQGALGITKAKYDTQEVILKGILDDLKAADQYFATGATFAGDPTPYAGDPAKWRRATNSFALKVLMSLSKKENVSSLDVKGRFAQIVAGGQLLASTTGPFGLNYSVKNQYPLFSAGNKLFTDRAIMSNVIINPLKALNDRRLFYYAEPARAQILAGKVMTDPAAYIGADVSAPYSTLSTEWLANKYSVIDYRYNKDNITEPRMLLTYSEQQLILSEARIRGWIATGSAQAYYEDGVKTALTTVMAVSSTYAHAMAITPAYITNYFTGEAAFKLTADEQLKQVWIQRYILNFLQDGDFSYWEYRRTGFPVFPINPTTSMNANKTDAIPLRSSYPSSESNYNEVNLKDAITRQFSGFDDVNKSIWVLQ